MVAVVDACLAVALIAPDPKQTAVAARFRAWLAAGEDLHAPAVFPYEIANVLARLVWDGSFDLTDVPQAWSDLQTLGIVVHPFELLADGPRVAAIANTLGRRHATDCAYISLAMRLGADAWTIDEPLAQAARAHGFPVRLVS